MISQEATRFRSDRPALATLGEAAINGKKPGKRSGGTTSLLFTLRTGQPAFTARGKMVYARYRKMWLAIPSYLATAVFLGLASYGLRNLRGELPSWRNVFGLISLSIVSANWLMISLWFVFHIYWTRFVSEESFNLIEHSPLVAGFLAVALKGKPRLYGIAAALLMTLVYLTSYTKV
jgi:hypothetical protein